jgi:hypothetical protein
VWSATLRLDEMRALSWSMNQAASVAADAILEVGELVSR